MWLSSSTPNWTSGADPKNENRPNPPLLDQTKADFPNPALVPIEVDTSNTKARFIRVEATKLAPRNNDYILALAEVQVLDRDGKNIAKGKKVTSLDSIQAPVRWARKNLVDGIWPEGADPKAVKALSEATKMRQKILAKIKGETVEEPPAEKGLAEEAED